MKKLFTLVALLAVFMGAKAEWVEDYRLVYSSKTGFPFYVMGYVPEWVDGVMTDYGAMYTYKTEAAEGDNVVGTVTTAGGVEYQKIQLESAGWHQYFIADGIKTELDGAYTVKAMVKASEAVNINVNMGWGWGDGESKSAQVSIGTDWEWVEWDYSGIGGSSCNLVAQPGTSAATIEWKEIIVGHNAKAAKPQVWQEWITSDGQPVTVTTTPSDIATYVGNANTPWPAWALEKDGDINANWRGERTGEICAWALTMGRNYDDQCPAEINSDSYRARPFPADIEADPDDANNKVFAVHITEVADIEGGGEGSAAWANQFWIQSPKEWKDGTIVKIKFRAKATKAAKVDTQQHKVYPSNYLNNSGIGQITIKTEWDEYGGEITTSNGCASLAFNLNSDLKETNDFYFDDLTWETMVLDEGWFVASSNASTGIEYDYDTAVELVYDAEDDSYVGTVGEVGKKDTWVNEVMISTVRGNDAAFKGATIKLTETFKQGDGEWLGYTTATLSKIKLPVAGAWQISVAPGDKQINFVKLDGEEEVVKDPVDIVTNTTVVTVKGQERDDIKDDDHPDGKGAAWDNQFFIVANREFTTGEKVTLKFSYKANKEAKTSTQLHGAPGAYIHHAAIGDVNFTEEWQDFEKTWEIAAGNGGAEITCKSIAFNMAEIKDACDYQLKDFQWYLTYDEDATKTLENLIDAEGTANFYVKEGAGTTPSLFGTPQHAITIAETQNGTATALKKEYEGAGVTIATTPAEGYEVDAVVVKAGDQDVAVKAGDKGTFTFEMPTSDVTITVTFKEAATGISNIAADKAKSAVVYNLAGQRVDNGFKGIVIKDGKKFVK